MPASRKAGIPKLFINVCSKFHGDPSNSSRNIYFSLRTNILKDVTADFYITSKVYLPRKG